MVKWTNFGDLHLWQLTGKMPPHLSHECRSPTHRGPKQMTHSLCTAAVAALEVLGPRYLKTILIHYLFLLLNIYIYTRLKTPGRR